MSGYREEMDFAISIVLQEILAVSKNRDSLRLWLSRYNRLEAEYFIAREYLAENRPQAADSVLQLAPQKFSLSSGQLVELDAVRDIVAILAGKDVFNLDSGSIAALKIYADSAFGHATDWARAIRTYYGYWYPVEYTLPEGGAERSQPEEQPGTTYITPANEYRMIPNPAGRQAMLVFPEKSTEALTLKLYDTFGRLVYTGLVSPEEVYFRLDLWGISDGLYFWNLDAPDRRVAGDKLLVNKK